MPHKATRLTAAVAASVAAMLALSACGSDSESDPTSAASDPSASASPSEPSPVTLADPKPEDAKAVKDIKVTQASDKKAPKITIKDKPLKVSETTRTILDKGTGEDVPDTGFVEVDLAMYSGKDGKMIADSETYSSGPIVLAMEAQGALPGLIKSIKDQKVGSHGVAVMPPKDVFGEQGAPQYGVDGKDSLVLVYDVRGVMPTEAEGTKVTPPKGLPTVKVNKDAPADITIPKDVKKPKKLINQKLIEGKGKTLKKGDQVYVNYTGVRLDDGTTFDTTFKEGRGTFAFGLGVEPSIPAWDKSLVGATVGDRLLLVVPSKEGYGKEGSPDGTIKPDTDLVFVVDVLGAY